MDDMDLQRIEQRIDLPALSPPRARVARGRPGEGVRVSPFFWARVSGMWGRPTAADGPYCYSFGEVWLATPPYPIGGSESWPNGWTLKPNGRIGYCWSGPEQCDGAAWGTLNEEAVIAVVEVPHYVGDAHSATYTPTRVIATPPYTEDGQPMPNWFWTWCGYSWQD